MVRAMVVLALSGLLCAVALAGQRGAPAGTFNGCPHAVESLPSSLASYAPAVRGVVLAYVRTSFARTASTPARVIGARTTGVFLTRKWLPSGWIKSECGASVWRWSVGVGVYFPALDKPHNPVGRCGDCARITFLVARTRSVWTVWGDY
jgi:hypothetical protein